MSEPDISTLAKRLAEQNNVDWRILTGTGPGGKVVERDVLDYLARVMAGEEAVDPTPEPLPEGMQTWPDQDAPSYFRPAPAAARPEPEPLAPLASAADAAGDPGDLLAGELLAEQVDDHADVQDDVQDDDQDDVDDLLSDDIFLFDDDSAAEAAESAAPERETLFLGGGASTAEPPPYDAPRTPWAPERFAEPSPSTPATEVHIDDAPLAGTDHLMGGAADPTDDATDYATADATEDDDADDALLVADDEQEPGAFEQPYAATAPTPEPAPLDAGAGDLFDKPLGGYSQEFTTPSEALESQGGPDQWGGDDLRLGADAFELEEEEPASDLPDLWAGEGGAGTVAADDVLDLEQAETLDELDSLEDLAALDETPDAILGGVAYAEDGAVTEAADVAAGPTIEAPPAARSQERAARPSAGALPFVRTGNVIRRHVDLSALAGAQLAAGLELGRDEPLTPAPFLLRAVAKAAAEAGGLEGQVALAELEGELRFRRVDAAAERPFAALVEELSGAGLEEDEIGLVAVDLSGFDLDEVLLDVDIPAVTLGRILYDTQRGAYRSTLTLSGSLPLERGAALLGRVAELLDAPVRLLL